jgi:hypothetical protein
MKLSSFGTLFGSVTKLKTNAQPLLLLKNVNGTFNGDFGLV